MRNPAEPDEDDFKEMSNFFIASCQPEAIAPSPKPILVE